MSNVRSNENYIDNMKLMVLCRYNQWPFPIEISSYKEVTARIMSINYMYLTSIEFFFFLQLQTVCHTVSIFHSI